MPLMRYIITIVLCLSFVGFSYTKLPPLKWVKNVTATTISPKFIIDISADRFLCADAKKIVVINANDGTVAATIPGFSGLTSISKTVDNKFVIADGNKITLLNSTLEPIWSKPVLNSLLLTSVIQTSDSGFAAIGRVADSTIIIKTDKKGDTLWTKIVTNSCTVQSGKKIIKVDGGFIAGGECCVSCIWMDGWISKYTNTGIKEWTKIITGLTIYDMIPVSNGVVLTGSRDTDADSTPYALQSAGLAKTLYFPDRDIPFIHIGADGILLANASFGGVPGGGEGRSLGNTVRKFEDIFVTACYYQTNTLYWVSIQMSSSTGVRKWRQEYNLPRYSFYDRPVAQPLSSRDLVIFASDSLYYYSDPTGFNNDNAIPTGAPLIGSNITFNQNRISFTLDKTTPVQMTLHALDGRIVHRFGETLFTAGKHSITFPKIIRGTYVLRLLYNGHNNVPKTILFR